MVVARSRKVSASSKRSNITARTPHNIRLEKEEDTDKQQVLTPSSHFLPTISSAACVNVVLSLLPMISQGGPPLLLPVPLVLIGSFTFTQYQSQWVKNFDHYGCYICREYTVICFVDTCTIILITCSLRGIKSFQSKRVSEQAKLMLHCS